MPTEIQAAVTVAAMVLGLLVFLSCDAIADDGRQPALKVTAGERTLGGATNGSPASNCSCRYRGEDVMLGQSICMKTNNGYVQAKCSRYLNNTSWTISRTPCTIS